MLYTNANTSEISNPVKDVIDANGLHWEYTTEIDTETGRIVKLAQNPDGSLKVNHELHEVEREEIYTAAPITVLFYKPQLTEQVRQLVADMPGRRCPKCEGPMAHYRLKGYQCARCC